MKYPSINLLCAECGHKLSEHKNAKIGTQAGCYHRAGKSVCECLVSREVIYRNHLPRVPHKEPAPSGEKGKEG